MGVFTKYSFQEGNLLLTEHLYWSFEANRKDSIREWTLLNIERSAINENQLDKIINYQEDADTEVIEKQGKQELHISTFLDQGNYKLVCDSVTTITRPYNMEELTSIILNLQVEDSRNQRRLSKYSQFIDHLQVYLENEKVRKERIIQGVTNAQSETVIKAHARLQLINQVLQMLSEFEDTEQRM